MVATPRPPRPPRTTARERSIAARRASVMPLEKFPPEHRARIEAEVAAPTPPARWRNVGLAQIANRSWYEWHWARGVDPDSKREPIPPTLRAAVIARDGHTCRLCGDPVDPEDIHLDHIHPYSKGGPTTLSNLQVTHSRCNIRKGARV